MAHRAPTSSTTQISAASRLWSSQMAQGSVVSRAPQTRQVRTFSAASARASLSGVRSWSRRLSSVRVARRAERGQLGQQGDQAFDFGSGGGGHGPSLAERGGQVSQPRLDGRLGLRRGGAVGYEDQVAIGTDDDVLALVAVGLALRPADGWP